MVILIIAETKAISSKPIHQVHVLKPLLVLKFKLAAVFMTFYTCLTWAKIWVNKPFPRVAITANQ